MAASQEAIFRALETSIFTFPEMPGRWEVLDFPGVRAHATPQTSHPIGNLVGVATLTEDNADAVIAQIRDFFAAREHTVGWWVNPSSTPGDLVLRLEAAGFTKVLAQAGQVLTTMGRAIQVNPAVTVRQATHEDRDALIRVYATAYPLPEALAAVVTDVLPLAAGGRHYLAFLAGVEEPVAVASMFPFPTSTVAVMQGAATLHAYRGQGVYTALGHTAGGCPRHGPGSRDTPGGPDDLRTHLRQPRLRGSVQHRPLRLGTRIKASCGTSHRSVPDTCRWRAHAFVAQGTEPVVHASERRPSTGPYDLLVASDARECAERIVKERVGRMDLQMKITEALDEHCAVIQQLTAMSSRIVQIASELVATLRRQGKVVLCGNGGSASDAQHMAAEMQGIRAHPGTPQGLLALVLTENTALLTAISNDVGYAAAFRRQVEAIVRSEDLGIGLSTSGRSPNVIEALRAAKQRGARTVAFLGEGGPLADIADIALCIPSTSVPRIQEAHMLIGHLICELAQRITTGEYQTRFTAHTG